MRLTTNNGDVYSPVQAANMPYTRGDRRRDGRSDRLRRRSPRVYTMQHS